GALPLSAGRGSKGGAPLWTVTLGPQWSPAFIGRERVYLSSGVGEVQRRPQWSPAFIGRERSPPRRTPARPAGRNGALPLSAGRGAHHRQVATWPLTGPQWSPAFIGRERLASTWTPRTPRR